MAKYFLVIEVDSDKAKAMATRSNVRAIYRKPEEFCDELNHGKQRGFRKSLKFGWWVCGKCRLPGHMYWENVHENSNLGRNLLSIFTKEA